MLYFLINGLETTEEECFTQQQKVFVSVFSISFSLAGFQLGKVTSGSASELHKLPTFNVLNLSSEFSQNLYTV